MMTTNAGSRSEEELASRRCGIYSHNGVVKNIGPGHALPEWLREAERHGVVRPPRVRHPEQIPLPPPKASKPARVLEALLEERRTGR